MTMRDIIKRTLVAGVIVASTLIQLGGSPADASNNGGQLTTVIPKNCPRGYLCLYDQQGFKGNVLRLYRCGDHGLERWSYPSGESWRDKARSVFNNQTGGADSVLYDTRNGSRVWVGALERPPSGFKWLSSNADKRIDFVHVC